jgi:hypothetical protein
MKSHPEHHRYKRRVPDWPPQSVHSYSTQRRYQWLQRSSSSLMRGKATRPLTQEPSDWRISDCDCVSTFQHSSLTASLYTLCNLPASTFLLAFLLLRPGPIEAAPLDPLLSIPPWRGRESRTRIRYAHALFSSPLRTIEARVLSEGDGCARASCRARLRLGVW